MPTVKYLAISMLFFLTYFLLVGQKGGDGFHIGFQKNGKSIFYGSSVRMGHKVYIFPILLNRRDPRDVGLFVLLESAGVSDSYDVRVRVIDGDLSARAEK